MLVRRSTARRLCAVSFAFSALILLLASGGSRDWRDAAAGAGFAVLAGAFARSLSPRVAAQLDREDRQREAARPPAPRGGRLRRDGLVGIAAALGLALTAPHLALDHTYLPLLLFASLLCALALVLALSAVVRTLREPPTGGG